MQIIKGFGFDMLRNQGSYPWSIPNEKDKNKSIMLQSSSATSTPQKQPAQSKTQSQPKKTPAPQPKPQVWETEESYKSRGTSPDFYEEFKKRSQDRMQHFGIGTLRQGNAANVFGNNTAMPQKKAPLEVQGELDLPQAKTEGIRRPGIEQVWWKTPQISPIKRKTSAIDPDAEELTPEGEAAFLEGLASVDFAHPKTVEPAISERAEFHPKQQLPIISNTRFIPMHDKPQPGTENEWQSLRLGDIADSAAAYEYAKDIIETAYQTKHEWPLPGSGLGFSPYEMSELRAAKGKVDSAISKTEVEKYIKELAAKGILGVISYKFASKQEERTFKEILTKKLKDIPVDILNSILDVKLPEDYIKDAVPNFTKHSIENAEQYLEFVNQGNRRYLIYSPKHREIFIKRINDEIKNIETAERFGFLPKHESGAFKSEILKYLKDVVVMNENYDYEKALLDEELKRIESQWAREMPPILTDSGYFFNR